MPKKIEYKNPDGSVGNFHDWTEEMNNADILDQENMMSDEKQRKKYEDSMKRKQKECDEALEFLIKNKNK